MCTLFYLYTHVLYLGYNVPSTYSLFTKFVCTVYSNQGIP